MRTTLLPAACPCLEKEVSHEENGCLGCGGAQHCQDARGVICRQPQGHKGWLAHLDFKLQPASGVECVHMMGSTSSTPLAGVQMAAIVGQTQMEQRRQHVANRRYCHGHPRGPGPAPPHSLQNCFSWLAKEPAMKDPKNTVMTCTL
jgi:hypothetical protein